MTESAVKEALEYEIEAAISDGFHTFISGMARGVDLWAADIVIEKRRAESGIKLIAASPFCGFEERWSHEWRQRYYFVLKEAIWYAIYAVGTLATAFRSEMNGW